MSVVTFVDSIAQYVTPWLARRKEKSNSFTFLWSTIQPLDVATEVLLQGLRARFPGVGTSTALALHGRSRGLLRGQGESSADYAVRLNEWIDRARIWGSQKSLARAIHEYLATRPKVRVVNRAGFWTTVDTDGTVTTYDAATPFTWDNVSHPERASHWWNTWVIVYTDQWDDTAWPDLILGYKNGVGHKVTPQEADAVKGLVAQHKSEHTYVRAIVFTRDPALFDPANSSTWPDGTWGDWFVMNSSRQCVPSGRNVNSCRIWET